MSPAEVVVMEGLKARLSRPTGMLCWRTKVRGVRRVRRVRMVSRVPVRNIVSCDYEPFWKGVGGIEMFW